jgi:hypothetical protein
LAPYEIVAGLSAAMVMGHRMFGETPRSSGARTICALACALLALAAETAGQSFYGGVRGSVHDADGIVTSVELTLLNEETRLSRTTLSNAIGEYAFPAVVPGKYRLRAVRTGYKTFERVELVIGTQESLTVDVLLEVGSREEEVTVVGATPLAETSASTGQVLDKVTLDILPNHGRNPYLIAMTLPTVIAFGDPHFDRQQDQNNTSFVSLGGAQQRTNNYLLDGVPTTNLVGAPSAIPTLEALAEVKVQVHTYDAEMGRTGGGVFNATARSGSNIVHGSAFYENRPVWGQANDFFAEREGLPKPTDLYFHLYGGSVGGPIVKDRSFFWVAFEGYRSKTNRTGQLFFPTTQERSGDFSRTFDANGNLIVIYDPSTTRQLPDGTYTRDPFPGNVIPPDRMSTVARNILSYFPPPDVDESSANGLPNYSRTARVVDRGDMATIKVEQKLGKRTSVSGLYLFNDTDEPDALFWGSQNPADPKQGTLHRRVHILALNGTVLVDPSTVATLRYGWTRYDDNFGPSGPFDLASLGFPSSFVDDVTFQGFPGGCIESSECFGGVTPTRLRWSSWGLGANVSKLVGRHTLKLGGDFRVAAMDSLEFGAASGYFDFFRGWTQADPFRPSDTEGTGIATFLLGLPGGVAHVSRPLQAFTSSYSAYVQDDMRLRKDLTVNVGLRYEYEAGLREEENRFAVAFDRDAVSPLAALTGLALRGGLRYAGVDGAHDYQGDPSRLKLSPRLGVVWTLEPKTVLRGGYGLFWSPWNYPYPSPLNYGQIGYSQSTSVLVTNPLVPSATLDDPFPNGLVQPVGNSRGLLAGAGGDIEYVSQERKSPRVQQYSFDVQRELPGRLVALLGYTGTHGDDMSYGGEFPGGVYVNRNQLPASALSLDYALFDEVPNPFFGIPEAGDFSQTETISRAQLLRPFPQFGGVFEQQTSGARFRYHAVTAMLERRFAGGWGGRVHYTWSRKDDDQFGTANTYSFRSATGPQNNYDLAAEYARSIQDVPHRVVLAPIAEVPFGKGKRWLTHGLGSLLLGGWTVALVARFESGSPRAIVQESDNSGSFSGVQRPNLTGVDPQTPGTTEERLDHYINPNAYAYADPFTFGNAPRTDPRIRSPFRTIYDIALDRDVKIKGRLKAQLRLEWLNLTNSATFFGGGDGHLGNPSFGTITAQANYPRVLQATVRAYW